MSEDEAHRGIDRRRGAARAERRGPELRRVRRRRGFLLIAAAGTTLLSLGTCAEMGVRIAINSVFDGVQPFLEDAADLAGRRAAQGFDQRLGGP